jgi:phospholipid/cholesterol/gamma-HCH transport system substrate-binding protein
LNFLKGVNIFSPTNSYHGTFAHLHGLEEQAAVYISGHKVGHVDKIHYDFTRDSAFIVDISINKDIVIPQGTKMALCADGLLGGMAVELQLSQEQQAAEHGSFLATTYVPGLIESVQGDLLAHVDEAVQNIDVLVAQLKEQVSGDHIKNSLTNVERISGDLTSVSANLKHLMATKVPTIVNNADTTIANLNTVVADIKAADLKSTVARVDTALENVNSLVTEVRKPIQPLIQHIDATVISADSLLVDLKAHPKRYVHFSLFGKKDN